MRRVLPSFIEKIPLFVHNFSVVYEPHENLLGAAVVHVSRVFVFMLYLEAFFISFPSCFFYFTSSIHLQCMYEFIAKDFRAWWYPTTRAIEGKSEQMKNLPPAWPSPLRTPAAAVLRQLAFGPVHRQILTKVLYDNWPNYPREQIHYVKRNR